MDFTLTEQQRRLQQIARTFADEEIRPRARDLDREVDPRATYPIDLIRRSSQLGLRTLKIPIRYGGFGADCLTEVIVLEEISAGDVGFGMTLQHQWREGFILAELTNDEQRARFLPEFLADETYVTSYAITEDHSGSDNSLPYTGDLSAGPRTTAILEGDEWVINGSKRFITNGNVSRVVVLFVRTDTTVPWTAGTSAILVPTEAPGFRVGRVESKLGIRLNQNAELFFENCRVPKANLLGEVNRGVPYVHRASAGSKSKEGAKALGVARAAYEAMLAWARERTSGGRTLVEHQGVRTMLADMAIEVEMARALMWRAAWAVDHDHDLALNLEDMAKICTGEVAMRVALRALDLFGPEGALPERPIEQLVRDAATMLHGGGGNLAIRDRLGTRLSRRVVSLAAI